MFDYGDLLCSSAQLKIVVKNGTQHCNIVHGISLRTEDEIVYSDVCAKVVRTVSITENSVKILSGLERKEGHSDFFNQLHCALSFQVYSYVIRLEKKINLTITGISSDGILSYLEHLEILLKTFGVHRRGEQRPVFTLEEGILCCIIASPRRWNFYD